MRAQASRALVVLAMALALIGRSAAYTDASCTALNIGLHYACNYYLDSSCNCGYGRTAVGSGSCCRTPPPTACASFNDNTLKTCSTNSHCYGSWADSGLCTGCGAGGVQKQVRPCNGEGADATRTVTVTCGTIHQDDLNSIRLLLLITTRNCILLGRLYRLVRVLACMRNRHGQSNKISDVSWHMQ